MHAYPTAKNRDVYEKGPRACTGDRPIIVELAESGMNTIIPRESPRS